MAHKKILDYFTIEGAPGGNQDWLPEWDMNRGGCGAVTACDVCIYLAGREKFRGLYPFERGNLSREDFIRFASIMKPYLSPRYHGIDFLETYICGFNDYLMSVKNNGLILEGLSANVSYESFEEAVVSQLNRDIPVPYLMLNHEAPELEDFEWHWFNLSGYEYGGHGLRVQTVTYGEYQWFGLHTMWETGHERKGGIIRIRER